MHELRASWKAKLLVSGGGKSGVEGPRFLWLYDSCMCSCGSMCLLASYFFTVLEFNIVVFVSVQSINQRLGGEVLNVLLSGRGQVRCQGFSQNELSGFLTPGLGSYTVFFGKHSASLYLGV